MIPFLKDKQASVASASAPIQRKPDEDAEPDYDGMEACMSELAAALKADDSKAAAVAFRAAFDLLESQPHEESADG